MSTKNAKIYNSVVHQQLSIVSAARVYAKTAEQINKIVQEKGRELADPPEVQLERIGSDEREVIRMCEEEVRMKKTNKDYINPDIAPLITKVVMAKVNYR